MSVAPVGTRRRPCSMRASACSSRSLYRLLDSPWVTAGSGGGDQTHTASAVTVGWAAYASLAGAALVTLAGIMQAVTHREKAEASAGRRAEQAA